MSASGLAVIAELGDLVGIDVLNPRSSDWMIIDAVSGGTVIVPDTVPKFEFRGDRRISDYPVEQGAFASYNKVQEPFSIRMQMVCSGLNYAQEAINALSLNIGQNYMQKADFLKTLDGMLATTDLFNIVTPDAIYKNANMEHYDYRRESNDGATMLKIEVWFREVRVAKAAAYTQTDSPSAADSTSTGSVKTFPIGAQGTQQLSAGPLLFGVQ